MYNMFPSEIGELQALKSQLLQYVDAKQNSMAIIQKQIDAKIVQEKNNQCAQLVKEVTKEEEKLDTLHKVNQLEKKWIQKMALNEQIEEKKITMSLEKAVIFSKSDSINIGKKLKEEKIKKKTEQAKQKLIYHSQLEEQINAQRIKKNEIEEEEKQIQEFNESLMDKKSVEEELAQQKKTEEYLQKCKMQLQQMQLLHENDVLRAEKKSLREQIAVLEKINEEEEVFKQNKIDKENVLQKINQERIHQIKIKEEIERKKKENEEEYFKLLMEVQREESKLDELRAEAKKRKILNHRDAVKKILNARKMRRQELHKEFEEIQNTEAELVNLKQQLLQEEEKKIILEHLPHLEAHLGEKLLKKLSSL